LIPTFAGSIPASPANIIELHSRQNLCGYFVFWFGVRGVD